MLNTLRRVTNTFTVSEAARDVQCIRIDHATFAIGKFSAVLLTLSAVARVDIMDFQLVFRQLVLCRVTLGKSFLQFNAMKMAHAPPGHHSVVGRPSVGGLSFPEYVVYRGEQVRVVIYCFTSFLTFCYSISITGLP